MDLNELSQNIKNLLYICDKLIDNSSPDREPLNNYIKIARKAKPLSHVKYFAKLIPYVTTTDMWLLNNDISVIYGEDVKSELVAKIPLTTAYKRALELYKHTSQLDDIPVELRKYLPELVYVELLKLYLYRILVIIDFANTSKYQPVIKEIVDKLDQGISLDSIIRDPGSAFKVIYNNPKTKNMLDNILNTINGDEFKSTFKNIMESINDTKLKELINGTLSSFNTKLNNPNNGNRPDDNSV